MSMVFKITSQMELNEYIGFSIENDSYCVNIEYVQEIIYVPVISKIPQAPSYIEGAINLRGRIIKIYNLRKWFRLPWKPIDNQTQIIIIDFNNKLFGILVDRVYDVFRWDGERKQEIPYLLAQQHKMAYAKSLIAEDEKIFIEISPEVFLESN